MLTYVYIMVLLMLCPSQLFVSYNTTSLQCTIVDNFNNWQLVVFAK